MTTRGCPPPAELEAATLDGVTLHAITVLGHDRPGIIAEATARLAGLGLNLEDCSMTRLRGHFAMTLVCAGGASTGELEAALADLAGDDRLTVTVREVEDQSAVGDTGSPWVLTVHGGDRPGIVSGVLAVVAEVGGNVTDLMTRLSGELYLLVAEIDVPDGVDVSELATRIRETARDLGVGATLRPAEVDEL